MDHVTFPYRASSHLILLHVVHHSGAWARNGIEADYDRKIGSSDAHKGITGGSVDFVGGNHVSTYAHAARGASWVYLGQTCNAVNHRLCVRPDSGIHGIQDLKEKKVGTRGSHPALNDWLFLKQRGLDVDRDDIELVNQVVVKKGEIDAAPGQEAAENVPKWHHVKSGKVDATIITPPQTIFAERAGLKCIDIEPLPMIHFTTISTSQRMVQNHPDVVERFIKGLLEGIAFFKQEPEKSKAIIKKYHTKEGVLDDYMVDVIYTELAQSFDPRLFPTMTAIDNVYQEAIRQDADAKKINPLSLWDLHFVKKLDDQGFVRDLYKGKNS